MAWVALAQVGPHPPWWVVALVLAFAFAFVRAAVSTFALVVRGGRGDGPYERLLAQLVTRTRALTYPPSIATVAADIIYSGVGVTPTVLLAAEADWGWTDPAGARLDDDAAPDPLFTGWLAEHGAPVFADDLEPVPPDLRELTSQILERYAARAILPVRSADELLGLILLPVQARRIRGRGLAFVERAADRFAEALLHARLAQRAAERAALAREVELAATVQIELLPARGPHVHGDVTVVGSWLPATKCAGDFWGVYPLEGGRVLVAIGDVTGHGVASAMVTAAALGACDVYVRRSGSRLDLAELMAVLDLAVRRVGGGDLAMTCFAALLDPAARDLAYASCGHTAPYLCRVPAVDRPPSASGSSGIELHALVGRGNPLGTGMPSAPRVLHRSLEPGDLVVWYTDGVVEAKDPAGRPYGDRRLQHLLKRIDRQRLVPGSVHELVQAGVSAHRAGCPLADDETVVVAQVAPAPAPEAAAEEARAP
jgi:serine phosphatase RsbU (regulator of sigma subunit)